MTVTEYWATFVSLVPNESINTNTFTPFSDEELEELERLRNR